MEQMRKRKGKHLNRQQIEGPQITLNELGFSVIGNGKWRSQVTHMYGNGAYDILAAHAGHAPSLVVAQIII